MDLGIGKAVVALWAAWNFWSIVMVLVVMVTGFVIWKVVITPKEYQERVAWAQAKENQKLTTPVIRRMGTTALIWLFAFMAAVCFVISVFKMFR